MHPNSIPFTEDPSALWRFRVRSPRTERLGVFLFRGDDCGPVTQREMARACVAFDDLVCAWRCKPDGSVWLDGHGQPLIAGDARLVRRESIATTEAIRESKAKLARVSTADVPVVPPLPFVPDAERRTEAAKTDDAGTPRTKRTKRSKTTEEA